VRDLRHLIRAASRQYVIKRPISIAFDEWNVWYRTFGEALQPAPALEEQHDLVDALCVAAFLNMLRRCCDAVSIANFSQTVNALCAVLTRSDGLVLQTVYYPLVMQREFSGDTVLDALAESDCFDTNLLGEQRTVGYLDACVTLDKDARALYLSCVNFHHSEGMRLRLKGIGAEEVAVHVLTGPDPESANTFDQPDVVAVRKETRRIGAGSLIELEPHSANVIELKLD
jgi:alpha-N-arabinofuranosidase